MTDTGRTVIAMLRAALPDLDAEDRHELARELGNYEHRSADEIARCVVERLAHTANNEKPFGQLLTLNEKAAQLQLNPGSLRRMAQEERIDAVKVGREWRFREDVLPHSHRQTERPTLPDMSTARRADTPPSIKAIRGR